MGWENVFHCEYDPFCQKVLNHHFPNSKLYEDIKTFDASNYLGRIDILSGGFPCQPFSQAGLRRGAEDDRHLWPQMLRIIREVFPRYVVGENVRGLINWSGGLVFEQVCADLENEGYEVTPYLLPACGKNAPHRRDRIWFIAKRNDPDTDSRGLEGTTKERRDGFNVEWEGESGDAPDTTCVRRGEDVGGSYRKSDEFIENGKATNWQNFPTQPPLCGGNDGLPKELDGITFPKWRKESIKAYGNAIVPQVAHEIFKAIQKMEDTFVP
jgi:DNA (cytosine-5)-methyltransferase 1